MEMQSKPKFKKGDQVMILYPKSSVVFGEIKEIVISDTIAYGIVCKGYGKNVYYFNERVVFPK